MRSSDFLEVFNEYVNSLNYPFPCAIGLLQSGESMAILPMPGGDTILFQDGSRDKTILIDVNVKSKNQSECYNILNDLAFKVEDLQELASKNNSFEFGRFKVSSLPSLITQDESGYYVYSVSLNSRIYIYEGVL